MLMSGGYLMENARIIATSIGNLIQEFDLKNKVYINWWNVIRNLIIQFLKMSGFFLSNVD